MNLLIAIAAVIAVVAISALLMTVNYGLGFIVMMVLLGAIVIPLVNNAKKRK